MGWRFSITGSVSFVEFGIGYVIERHVSGLSPFKTIPFLHVFVSFFDSQSIDVHGIWVVCFLRISRSVLLLCFFGFPIHD